LSYLLDALRKSEAQRRLGATPSIHAEAPVVPRRRRLLPAALVAGTVALMLGWWLLAPHGGQSAPDAPATPQLAAANGADRAPASRPAGDTARPAQTAPAQDNAAPPAGSRQPASTRPRSRQRTGARATPEDPGAANRPGVEREIRIQPAPGQGGAAAREAQTRPAPGQTPEPTAPESGSAQRAAPPKPPPPSTGGGEETAGARSGSQPVAAESTRQPARDDAGVAAGAATEPPAQDGAGGPIDYWELPVPVRTSLPEIKLSIRVYDPEPAKRFVILGRERYGEGDQIAEGVTLSEIRRDGVVLEYQDYRFRYGD